MHYTKHTRNEFLYKLHDLTSKSISVDAIRTVVSGYGYDSIKLQEGRRLVESFERLNNEATRQSISKKKMYAQKKKMQAEIHKKYMKIVKLSRIAFSNDMEAQGILGLNGARERTYEKWYYQVFNMVNRLLEYEEYMKALGQFGVGEEDIEGLRKELDVLDTQNNECTKITAIVRLLNSRIKKETVIVQQWISQYIKVARIAMDEHPQLGKVLKKTLDS